MYFLWPFADGVPWPYRHGRDPDVTPAAPGTGAGDAAGRSGSPAYEDLVADDEDPDLVLALLVADRLTQRRRLRKETVAVVVQDRVVILSGSVASRRVRDTAGDIVWRTPGVRDVCNRLEPRH